MLFLKKDIWQTLAEVEKNQVLAAYDEGFDEKNLLEHKTVEAKHSKWHYAVKWTKQANEDLYQMVEYAEAIWSNQAFHAFIETVFASLDLIATFPEMGLSENKRKRYFTKFKFLLTF